MNTTWDSVLEDAHRVPLTDLPEAYSGARLERLELPDGQQFVLKHLAPDGDWLTRATNGTGRMVRMWESGVFDRVGAAIDHTVVDVLAVDGGDAVLIRDATDDLFPPRGRVSRSDSRQALAGLAAMHDACEGIELDGGTSVGDRYAMFAIRLHADPTAPGAHPARDLIRDGWAIFADKVETDLVEAVFAIHDDPSRLDRAVASCTPTLVHGDVKLPNLGLATDGRLVAIDWADITGIGPREVDVGWYALMATRQIGGSPADTFDDYVAAHGRPLDPVALDIAYIGSLAQMGCGLAAWGYSGPENRASERAQLEFWCERSREALDRLSL